MLTEPMGMICEFCGKIVSKKLEKRLKEKEKVTIKKEENETYKQ
jgi:hypothetical protein